MAAAAVPVVLSPLAAALAYLADYFQKNEPDYTIWPATLQLLGDRILASNYDRLLFVVCSDEACILQGYSSPQRWAKNDPESFLSQVLALPPRWPASAVGIHECESLGQDLSSNTFYSYFVRSSPQSFIFPSSGEGRAQGGEAVATCNPAHLAGHTGSVFVLRRRFLESGLLTDLTTPSLQLSLCSVPELCYFRVWLDTAGLAGLCARTGNFTLLAPVNAAFEALARTEGVSALELVRSPRYAYMAGYHVMCGFFGPLAPPRPPTEATVASDGFLVRFVAVTDPQACGGAAAFVNFARIDLQASAVVANGFLYVLDSVLSHGASGPAPC